MATRGVLDDRVFEEVRDSFDRGLDPGVVGSIDTEIPDPATPRNLPEAFRRGVDAGVAGLQSGGQNFNALFNSIVGDDRARDIALARAQEFDNEAATALQNIQSFEEFTKNPSFSGAMTQFVVAGGQALPSLITQITGALATGGASLLVNAGGRALIAGGSALAAKKLIKEAAENVAQDVATPDEKKLVDQVYDALKGFTFKRGSVVGATAAGYVPLAGQNFAEGIEVGREPDIDLALRSLTVAAPQAALEVATPFVLLKSLGKVAKSKSVGDQSSVLGGLIKDIGKATVIGGITETATETGQEGIAILNRLSMDPDYSTEEIQLRLGQAAFTGFAGGKTIGAATGTVGGSIRATKRIFDKASQKIQEAKDQQTDAKDNEERFGDLNTGRTTPESAETLSAQIDAVLDERSTKKAVWAEGRKPEGIEPNTVTEIEHNGKTIYAAHIPGRGTIFGSKQIVEDVLADGATDEKLGQVLGYSSSKPSGNPRIVVQALDENGNVVSEELTDRKGRKAAVKAAKGLSPIGKHRVVSIDKAMSERKERFDAEQNTAEPTETTETTEPATQFNVGDEVTIQFDEVERGGAALRDDEIAPVTAKVRRIKRADGTVFYDLKDPRPNSGSIIFSEADIESGKVTLNPTKEQQDALKAKRDAAKKALQEKARKENENDPEMQEAARQAAALQQEREQFERRRKQAQENFKPKDEQGLLAAIAARGGISRTDQDVRENSTFFKEHFRERVGSKFVFTNNGKSMTEMYEDLQGDGWYPPDPDGRPNEYGSDVLREDLVEALGSDEPFYTPMKSDIAMEAQARQREEDEQARREFEFEAEPPKFREDTGPAPTEQGGLFDNPDEPVVKGMDVPEDVRAAFAGVTSDPNIDETDATETGVNADGSTPNDGVDTTSFTEIELEETTDVVEGKVKENPYRTFENTFEAREAFMAMFGEVNWNDIFYAGMTETFLQKVADAQLDSPNAEFNITLEGGKYVARKTDKKPDPLDESKDGIIRGLLLAAQDSKARGSGAFLITPEGKTRPINLARLSVLGKRLLADRGEPIYDEKLVPPQQAASRGLATFLADMQLAETGYDIQIGRTSIFDIDSSKPLRDQVDSDYVTGAIVDNSAVTLTDLLQPKTPAARPVTYTVRGEEGGGSPFPQQTFDNRKDAEAFVAEVEARGGIATITDDKPTYFDPTFMEGRNEGSTFAEGSQEAFLANIGENNDPDGGVDESSRIRERQLYDEAGMAIPKTRLNLEMDPKYQLKGRATNKSGPYKFNLKVNFATGSLGKVADRVVNQVNKIIRPGQTIHMFGVQQLNNMSEKQIIGMFGDARVGRLVHEQYTNLRDTETALGRYISFPNAHVVLVDNTSGNPLQTALVAAHELGHVLFQEEMTRSLDLGSRRAKLIADYEKSEHFKNGLDFEEWFADQTAIYAKALYFKERKAAKGVTQRMFQKIAQKLVDMWRTVLPSIKQRLDKRNTSDAFTDFIDNTVRAVERNVASNNATGVGDIKYKQKALIRDMQAAQNDKAQKAVANIFEKFSGLLDNAPGQTLLRVVLAEDNILRKISPKIADMFYVQSNAESAKVGFIKSKDHVRGQIYNQLEDMLGTDWETDEVKRALNEAADQTVKTEDLDGKAREVREWLIKFYDSYIAETPGNDIQRREDYFPIALDLAAIYNNEKRRVYAEATEIEHQWSRTVLGAQNGFLKDGVDPEGFIDYQDLKEVRELTDAEIDSYLKKEFRTERPFNELTEEEKGVVTEHRMRRERDLANPEQTFLELVMKYNPELEEDSVKATIDGLVAMQQHILDDAEITFDATDPVKAVEKARVLTENIPQKELAAFTEPPELALMKYIRHVVTRQEFKRATHDANGNNLLDAELEKLDPAQRKQAVAVVERYLGYTKNPMNPTFQKVSSYMQMFNWITLLPLATIGSLTELGGAIINTREFNGFQFAAKSLVKNLSTLGSVQEREQAVALARTLGVSWSTAMGNLGLTDADAEYLDPRVRKYSDKFFKSIGLDWFTRFTREFSATTAVEFLLNHSDPKTKMKRSERYLRDHGVTAEQVNRWKAQQKDGEHYTFDGDDGKAVKAALQRFVENSMLRPNAAERPAWANDPRYQLVWALKSYLYSFGKVIIGGMKREMGKRLGEGGTTMEMMSAVGMVGVLAAASFMPLAMMSLELRELAKAGIAGLLPGVEANARYFRSDRMDYGDYFAEMFDRSGFAGPLAIVTSAFKSVEWGQTGVGAIFGPTAGLLIDDIGMGLYRGKDWEIIPARIIPGYSLVL